MNGRMSRGFTFMELMVVLLMIALLASIVTPIVTKSISRAKESSLKENLFLIRKAIDDYYTDTGTYPEELEILVEKRYIRSIPVDPLTDKATWKYLYDQDESVEQSVQGIIDIRSTSEATALDGSKYNEW